MNKLYSKCFVSEFVSYLVHHTLELTTIYVKIVLLWDRSRRKYTFPFFIISNIFLIYKALLNLEDRSEFAVL